MGNVRKDFLLINVDTPRKAEGLSAANSGLVCCPSWPPPPPGSSGRCSCSLQSAAAELMHSLKSRQLFFVLRSSFWTVHLSLLVVLPPCLS